MKVQTVIQPSANIVRITSVEVGSVYKRLDNPTYGDPRMLFGVVTDIMTDGENSAMIAIEFVPPTYNSGAVEPTLKTFKGDSEVSIYPAQPEEFKVAMEESMAQQERSIEEARKSLDKKQAVLTMMEKTLARPMHLAGTTVIEIEG